MSRRAAKPATPPKHTDASRLRLARDAHGLECPIFVNAKQAFKKSTRQPPQREFARLCVRPSLILHAHPAQPQTPASLEHTTRRTSSLWVTGALSPSRRSAQPNADDLGSRIRAVGTTRRPCVLQTEVNVDSDCRESTCVVVEMIGEGRIHTYRHMFARLITALK